MALKKKGGQKERSAINKVVTQEYTVNIYKLIRGMGCKKRAPWALKEIQTFAMKEMGTPDIHINIRFNRAVWAEGIRNVPCHICLEVCHTGDKGDGVPSNPAEPFPAKAREKRSHM
ncbi:60S ribosomal protein L31-like [Phodopus roborovskii]|uniref:60S ribosomal protein L31-like n=1 Tax=Phodopus roborovskii TaxID=109678 RepID=UPI0021E4084D|nr:60S ribosomal protein L31-like [Phodopus roborovskii]